MEKTSKYIKIYETIKKKLNFFCYYFFRRNIEAWMITCVPIVERQHHPNGEKDHMDLKRNF